MSKTAPGTSSSTPQRFDKVDVALFLTALGLGAYVVWLLWSNDDDGMVRAAYYRSLAETYQALAYHFGTAGIHAELQYHKALELGRMI